MSEDFFKENWCKYSEFPSYYIPKDGEIFISTDQSSGDMDCTVKGFYDPVTGELHIQEVIYREGDKDEQC